MMILRHLPFMFVISHPIPETLEPGFRLRLKLNGPNSQFQLRPSDKALGSFTCFSVCMCVCVLITVFIGNTLRFFSWFLLNSKLQHFDRFCQMLFYTRDLMFLYKMPTKHIPSLLLYYRPAVKAINGQYLLFEANGLAFPLLSFVLLKNILFFF